MKKEINERTRDQQIFYDYERVGRNGAQLARKYNISRQRVHQIVLRQAKMLGRKPKWYQGPEEPPADTRYQRDYHE